MINGVLVERTVADVVPSLKTNSEGLKKVLDDLLKQYKTKQEEMEKWKVRGSCICREPSLLTEYKNNSSIDPTDLLLINC
jgi:polyhydroxyalkanoate synthesis regulator phasin